MKHHYLKRISSDVLSKYKLLFTLAVIFLIIAVWNLIWNFEEWSWAILGLAVGVIIGHAMTLFDQYIWQEGEDRVVSVSNRMASVVLILYLLFTFTEEENILAEWISRPEAVRMAAAWITVGALGERVFRMRKVVLEMVRQRIDRQH